MAQNGENEAKFCSKSRKMPDVSFYSLNDRDLFFREVIWVLPNDSNLRVMNWHGSCNYSAKDALGLTQVPEVVTLIS